MAACSMREPKSTSVSHVHNGANPLYFAFFSLLAEYISIATIPSDLSPCFPAAHNWEKKKNKIKT